MGMKLFIKKDKFLYLVIAYWIRPKVGEMHLHQPLIKGIYRNINKAHRRVNEIKSMHMYEYVTLVSITTDL